MLNALYLIGGGVGGGVVKTTQKVMQNVAFQLFASLPRFLFLFWLFMLLLLYKRVHCAQVQRTNIYLRKVQKTKPKTERWAFKATLSSLTYPLFCFLSTLFLSLFMCLSFSLNSFHFTLKNTRTRLGWNSNQKDVIFAHFIAYKKIKTNILT